MLRYERVGRPVAILDVVSLEAVVIVLSVARGVVHHRQQIDADRTDGLGDRGDAFVAQLTPSVEAVVTEGVCCLADLGGERRGGRQTPAVVGGFLEGDGVELCRDPVEEVGSVGGRQRGAGLYRRAGPRRVVVFDIIAVEIDEPRHDEPAVGVDRSGTREGGIRCRPDLCDPIAGQDDAAVSQTSGRCDDLCVADLGDLAHRWATRRSRSVRVGDSCPGGNAVHIPSSLPR